MKQILVTVDTNQPLQNIRKAINMLRGVVSDRFAHINTQGDALG